MRIAVLGTGMVGRAVSSRLAELGHEVTVGTRDPEATRSRPDHQAAPGVDLATFAEAAREAELVVNATNGSVSLEVLDLAGADNLAGKVLVDIANPLDFSQGFPPTLSVKDSDSLGEQIQRAFPATRVVKTLNTMNADVMVHPQALAQGDHTVFVSGDDDAAKETVRALLTSMGHTDVIDLGDITTARGAEMLLPVWLRLMGALGTPAFNFKVVR
jgi:8-hydroxy-5-deazaflavin:NADPH oxidoreductase